MDRSLKVNILITTIVILLVLWGIGTKNSLILEKESVNLQYAQLETNLQRRADLIPNLVNTVKEYANHEETIFIEIANARASLDESVQSGDIQKIARDNSELSSTITKLIAIVEDYPDLKADQQFIGLQDELAGTENRISLARQQYNEAVNKYNSKIQQYPTIIVAKMAGFHKIEYFEADETAQKVPNVSFD